jgi:hypothetical protein
MDYRTQTIQQLTNEATSLENDDLIPVYQSGATKKISARNFFKNHSSAGGLAFVGTRAEYEQAKLIPEGQTGHIPNGTLVCITDENTYLMGEQKTINRRKGGRK